MAATATLEKETDALAQNGQERETVVKVQGLTIMKITMQSTVENNRIAMHPLME